MCARAYVSGRDCSGQILAFGESNSKDSRKVQQLIGGSQGQRVYAPEGLAITQTALGGGFGTKTGMYLIDLNAPPNLTDTARCITARQDSGVSNRKGEHSAVFVDEGPRAIINPFKEKTYQNGRRIKEPNEPMFTITVCDRHGVIHKGRIRRLMPIECWKLQGFTSEQFHKVQATGMTLWKAELETTGSTVETVMIHIHLEKVTEMTPLKIGAEVVQLSSVTSILMRLL